MEIARNDSTTFKNGTKIYHDIAAVTICLLNEPDKKAECMVNHLTSQFGVRCSSIFSLEFKQRFFKCRYLVLHSMESIFCSSQLLIGCFQRQPLRFHLPVIVWQWDILIILIILFCLMFTDFCFVLCTGTSLTDGSKCAYCMQTLVQGPVSRKTRTSLKLVSQCQSLWVCCSKGWRRWRWWQQELKQQKSARSAGWSRVWINAGSCSMQLNSYGTLYYRKKYQRY